MEFSTGLGKIHIYTGHGKGKSLAALGLAVKLAGQGKKIAILYFDRLHHHYHERNIIDRFDQNIESYVVGLNLRDSKTGDFTMEVYPEDFIAGPKGMKTAEELSGSGNYDVLILDEINMAVTLGVIQLEILEQFLLSKPAHLDLVLTGRECPEPIVKKADFVTYMNTHNI